MALLFLELLCLTWVFYGTEAAPSPVPYFERVLVFTDLRMHAQKNKMKFIPNARFVTRHGLKCLFTEVKDEAIYCFLQ